MSVSSPRAIAWTGVYGPGQGRGDVEQHVIQTLRDWIVAYIANFEAEHGIPARSTPIPPTPESIHGDLDFNRFGGELLPELIVVAQPTGEVERFFDDGTYGSWYQVAVGAICHVEGDQEATRALGDIYGMCLQKLLPQQGAFGKNPDGSYFATRTRLQSAYNLVFPEPTVRDVVRATTVVHTFVADLVSDSEGLRVPPQNPYGTPPPWPTVNKVEVNIVRTTPDAYSGTYMADAVILDATVNPEVTEFEETTVTNP